MTQLKTMKDATYPIEDVVVTSEHDLPTHGKAEIKVEVIDFDPHLESWEFTPSYVEENPRLDCFDKREMPARWYGKDRTLCNVSLHPERGEPILRHASLVRSVRPPTFYDSPATWRTSCMICESTGISIGIGDARNHVRPHRGNSEMFWELAGPDPISLRENMQRLADEAYRLFEPKMQNRI